MWMLNHWLGSCSYNWFKVKSFITSLEMKCLFSLFFYWQGEYVFMTDKVDVHLYISSHLLVLFSLQILIVSQFTYKEVSWSVPLEEGHWQCIPTYSKYTEFLNKNKIFYWQLKSLFNAKNVINKHEGGGICWTFWILFKFCWLVSDDINFICPDLFIQKCIKNAFHFRFMFCFLGLFEIIYTTTMY